MSDDFRFIVFRPVKVPTCMHPTLGLGDFRVFFAITVINTVAIGEQYAFEGFQ